MPLSLGALFVLVVHTQVGRLHDQSTRVCTYIVDGATPYRHSTGWSDPLPDA